MCFSIILEIEIYITGMLVFYQEQYTKVDSFEYLHWKKL